MNASVTRLPVNAGQMTDHDTINYRLTAMERAVAEMAKSQAALTKAQSDMSVDLRLLIKEQLQLTKAMEGIAMFQSDVRHMHSTQTRLFGRVERQEKLLTNLRDEFNVYRATNDARAGIYAWLIDHWQFVLLLSGVVGYIGFLVKQVTG